MKINVAGFSDKKSKLDLDFDVNTTAEVGFVQPVLCEEVIPQASYDLNCRSMVQVAPLLSPLFGRLSLRQFTSFVPMHDVMHHFDEVITSRKVTHGSGSQLVTKVPTVNYRSLIELLLLQESICTCWYLPGNNKPVQMNAGLIGTTFNTVFDSLNLGFTNIVEVLKPSSQTAKPTYTNLGDLKLLYLSNSAKSDDQVSFDFDVTAYGPGATNPDNVYDNVNPYYQAAYGNQPTIEDADYVLYFQTTMDGHNYNCALCFRLSQRGRALRKVMIGLGLNIDLNSFVDTSSDLYNRQINILPFLAYYKAWFDIMYPKRSINFANTNCGKIISGLDSSSFTGTDLSSNSYLWSMFVLFVTDLANMTYVFGNDYYTAHLQNLGSNTENGYFDTLDGMYNSVTGSSNLPAYLTSQSYSGGTQSQISSAGLKLLSMVNNAMLSGTWIGKRVNDYLRQYGVFTDEDESNFISSNILDIDTGQVLSTNENDNIFLGQKAGQAEGRSDRNGNIADTFKFTAKEHGYIVKFIVVVPKSNFSQGIDPKFFRKSRFDFFNQQFDGIGYELTPGSQYFASNPVTYYHPDVPVSSLPAIGYIGRYSNYKYKTNIANGDFTRRATRMSIGSYYLDKRFPENDIYMMTAQSYDYFYNPKTQYSPVISQNNVPLPTEAIRFCKNELFDYNRIFVSRDDIENTKYLRRFFEPVDDHFIIHQVYDFKAFAPVLAISDAQGTTDSINESKQESNSVEMS